MLSLGSVNWIAVVVGTALSMALGAVWYGPLFGNTWLRLIGKRPEEIESNPLDYLKTTVASFIAMLALNLAVAAFGASSLWQGVLTGGLVFLGLGGTATFVYTTFEGPPTKVWLLYSSYQIVVFAIMGAVFAVWV